MQLYINVTIKLTLKIVLETIFHLIEENGSFAFDIFIYLGNHYS